MNTVAEINRLIRAAIRAAKKEGVSVPFVEVTVNGATVQIPLVPDKPIAKHEEIVL